MVVVVVVVVVVAVVEVVVVGIEEVALGARGAVLAVRQVLAEKQMHSNKQSQGSDRWRLGEPSPPHHVLSAVSARKLC